MYLRCTKQAQSGRQYNLLSFGMILDLIENAMFLEILKNIMITPILKSGFPSLLAVKETHFENILNTRLRQFIYESGEILEKSHLNTEEESLLLQRSIDIVEDSRITFH